MDIVIGDSPLVAIQTEQAASTAFATAATAGATLPTGTNTADQIAGALWAAAGAIYAGTKGIGSVFAVVPTGLLGAWGALFAPYGPMNQQGQGFSAADFSTGLAGVIAGIPIRVTAYAGTALVLSSAGRNEQVGSLQVVEPSVLGVRLPMQATSPMVIEATGSSRSRRRHDRRTAGFGRGGTLYDAPNQQVVREATSPPWDEGAGGGGNPDPQTATPSAGEDSSADLDAMTKDELLAHAQQLGISPANASMTKDELRAGIDQHQGQG
jgi:hypothetical protein